MESKQSNHRPIQDRWIAGHKLLLVPGKRYRTSHEVPCCLPPALSRMKSYRARKTEALESLSSDSGVLM
jgi:hypothetical protein